MVNRVCVCIAVVVAVIACGCYKVYFGCDKEKEHNELTCPDVLYLSLVPLITDAKTHIIGFLSRWGLVDFNSSFRYLFDRGEQNSSLFFTSPNLTQLPVNTQECEIIGHQVFIYTPNDIQHITHLPVLVYFHGGGGTKYSPKLFDASMRYLSNKMKLKIMVPNYPLSPGVLIPAAHNECLKIVTHIFDNTEKFGINPKRVSIGGDSFGSHVSLYIAFKWKEFGYTKKYAPLLSMSLIYPWVQFVNLNLESFHKKENQPKILSTSLIATYISLLVQGSVDLYPLIIDSRLPLLSKHYRERQTVYPHLLPTVDWEPPASMVAEYSHYADKVLDPYATFLFQPDFSGLPPTLIISAEYDVLLTEGQLLKERLEQSGVEVEYFVSLKMFHGFFIILPPNIRFNATLEAYGKLDEFLHKFIERE